MPASCSSTRGIQRQYDGKQRAMASSTIRPSRAYHAICMKMRSLFSRWPDNQGGRLRWQNTGWIPDREDLAKSVSVSDKPCREKGMGKGLKVLAGTGITASGASSERTLRRKDRVRARQAHAKYLLIYDTPTEQDVYAGLPMAGPEGDLLASLVEHAKIDLHDVYCTPMLGCRPTMLLPAGLRTRASGRPRAGRRGGQRVRRA